MGQFTGDYSRPYPGMFDKRKRYLGILPQQSKPGVDRPIVDADLLDHLLSNVEYLRTFMEEVLGSGAPGDGFKIVEASSSANNFSIKSGSFYNNGLRANLDSDTDYMSDGSIPNDIHPKSTALSATVLTDSAAKYATNELVGRKLYPNASDMTHGYDIIANTATTITISSGDMTAYASAGDYYVVALSTPSSARTDWVYLDCYLDEWDKDEDPNLLHTINGSTYETCNRLKVVQLVKVAEDGDSNYTNGIPDNGNDSDGNYHWYVKIAKITREGSNPNITTSMIKDYRLDIKRALWEVPDLDVGGGYGDVVDGGLSVYQDGELKTDSSGLFDKGLKVNDKNGVLSGVLLNIDSDKDYNSSPPTESYIRWGNSSGNVKLGWKSGELLSTIGFKVTPIKPDGSPDDGGVEVDSSAGADKKAFFKLKGKNSSGLIANMIAQINPLLNDPNIVEFAIEEESGSFTDKCRFVFKESTGGDDVLLDIEGHLRTKKNIYLNKSSAALDTFISFAGDESSTARPEMKYLNASKKVSINVPFGIDTETSPDKEIPIFTIESPDVDSKRAAKLQFDVEDGTGSHFYLRLMFGEDTGYTPNDKNYAIISINSKDGSPSKPDTLILASEKNDTTFADTDLMLDVRGIIESWGSYFQLNKDQSTPATADSKIYFCGDTARGYIRFDGSQSVFETAESITVHKNRNEDSYLEVQGYSNKKAYLQLRGYNASTGTNFFRITVGEDVTVNGGTEPTYAFFLHRWDTTEFGGNPEGKFYFQVRDKSDNVQDNKAILKVFGSIKQTDKYLKIKDDGTTVMTNSGIHFGPGDPMVSGVWLEANPPDFDGWLKVGSSNPSGQRGLAVTGFILTEQQNGIPIDAANGAIWIDYSNSPDPALCYYSQGQAYKLVGTAIP